MNSKVIEPEGFVPPEIDAYCFTHSSKQSINLETIERLTKERFPDDSDMLINPIQVGLLQLLVSTSGARNVLEIGTFTGYSAVAMVEVLPPNGRVVTLDVDSSLIGGFTKPIIEKFGLGHIIHFMVGDAHENLEIFQSGSMDLVFIDAEKQGYLDYWKQAKRIVKKGGIIIVDDVLQSANGNIVNPDTEITKRMDAFNKLVSQDKQVKVVLTPIGDGMTIARKL